MRTIEEVENEIEQYILNAEEYPTAGELVSVVVGRDQFKFALYLRALNNLVKKGHILYDDKHDSWLYTKPTSRMKEWMKDTRPV